MTDIKLIQSSNPDEWAAVFTQHAKDRTALGQPVDQPYMADWFRMALEFGRDEARRETSRTLTNLVERGRA